jgi:tetratricopeptide (TPR) repeat protein/tRNA A-37 threonylcarbamoyl transferase component Bud32
MIGRTLSHYRVLEKLGEGGMGVVYVAEDTVLGRRVAIKMLHSRRSADDLHFRARFLREARAVSALSHPHIATVHDYGETEDGDPYIVMELIKGETLGELMLTEKLNIARSIEIIKQVGEALGEAHRHGIIHRDIKPTNVAINERGRVKVLDFGLAKQMALSDEETTDPERQTLVVTHTREGVIVGTPLYLSPEQAMGNEVDARSDLFSLGGLLYECVAGKPPFFGKSPADICAKVMRDDPAPPSTLNPDIPTELDQLILKSLAKKPDARYQSAEEMISDLESLQAHLLTDATNTITRLIPAVGPRPTGAFATLSDIFRRPRLPVGYVVAGVFAVALLLFGLWFFLRARPHQPNPEALRLYEAGTNALRAGSFFQASKALELAIRSDDQFALAHARLAEAWMELDYSDRAKDELLRVGELTPNRSLFTKVDSLYLDGITATVRRDFPRAVTAYAEVTQLQPNQSYSYVDLGRAYEKNNELDKAIESYTTAANKDPQNAPAFLRLGVLLGRKHDNEAGAALDKADSLYQAFGIVEGRAEVAFQRGVLLNDIGGKIDEARAQLEQARDFARVVASVYQQIRILYQLSNVAIKAGQTDQALKYADEAIQLAQTNQMESLIARGNIEIGNIYLGAGKYNEAEEYFQRALDAAQRYGARQNEARARLTLASVYVQKGEADRALALIDQAVSFYQAGGYRTEVRQALILRARTFKQKGDYKSALQAFQEQLSQAEQSSDQSLIAFAHVSVGGVLLAQEQYAEARRHFEESRARFKAAGNKLYEGYALMSLGITLWHLGNYQEAHNLLQQASEIAKQNGSSFTALEASVDLAEAEIALSLQKFNEVEPKAKQALDLAGTQDKQIAAQAKILIALSQARSGRGAAGLAMCQQARDAAAGQTDPLLVAQTQLCVAEAALLSNDSKRAMENAGPAQTFFANSGMAESGWRASLIAGLASQRNLDRENAQLYLKNANDAFSSLEQKWGAEAFKSYQERPDIQTYRRQLEQNLAAAR